jgi:hypothetical protein
MVDPGLLLGGQGLERERDRDTLLRIAARTGYDAIA